MQAGTAVSAPGAPPPPPPPSAPFDLDPSTTTAAFLPQRRQSHRSTSLSSGSVVTVNRPGSISRIRSQSPAADANLIPLRLGRDPMSNDHKRRKSVALDPSEHSASDSVGIGAVNRWSQSTTSSLASQSRRNRSSSGAVLSSLVGQSFSPRSRPHNALDASPRASPHRKHVANNSGSLTGSPQRSRRTSTSRADITTSLTALPPLHTTPALTDPNDTESPSTTQTLQTPLSQPTYSYSQNDYFDHDDALAPYGMAKTKRVMMVRNHTAPMQVTNTSTAAGSESQETIKQAGSSSYAERERRSKGQDEGNSHRRPRTRERTEKDKKTMLSKALQKANTAVLLDNAQNYDGALEAYSDACDLLTQVMDRTSGEDDKRKLDAIRVTYSNRMEELRILVQERPTTSEEKGLPARPMSEDSLSLKSPQMLSPAGGVQLDVSPMEYTTTRSTSDIPRLSYPRNDRDSFFQRTMEAVASSGSFDTSHDDEQQTVAGAQVEDREPHQPPRRTSVHLPPPEHSEYVPRPLSPRKPRSPKLQPQVEESWQREIDRIRSSESDRSRDRADSKDSTSWLDTIDESGDSCSDSDDFHDQQGNRRKHIRDASNETDPDFDAAFDAAVEAAYDEGLEPDLEARRKRLTALRRVQNESVQIPASEINEILPGEFNSTSVLDLDPDDEEEERILDEIAHDYGQTFNFDLKTKSALPRQSDSSGYSRSTWQSSSLSDRATAATSLSTVAEDGLSSRLSKPSGAGSFSRIRGESTALPPPTAPPSGALPRPPSAGNNHTSVRSGRLSGLNSKQLKIETSPQPAARKRASTFHHTASPFLEDEEDQHETTSEKGEKIGEMLEPTQSDATHDNILQSPPSLEFHQALDEMTGSNEQQTLDYRPSYEEVPSEQNTSRPTLFRKNKSSVSLRDHAEHTVLLASPDPESGPSLVTPMSSTFMSFASRRNPNPLTSQRANVPSLGQSSFESQQAGGGIYLFDTSLSASVPPTSPRSPNLSPLPTGLEPCPESYLLRPFWLMRALSQTITHPRGGFLTTKLFVPRESWQTRGVKLKLVEDKVANCDLLTAALGRLAGVDTYDADAVADELQSFEEVMERVQAVLAKKLGSDVGVHGVNGMFKDASAATVATAMGNAHGPDGAPADKAAKSNSGKSYLTSWRKLRNKSSGTPLSSGSSSQASSRPADKEQHSMPSVPMTSFVPVERRGNKKEARNLVFDGPNKEYMGSLARLFDGVQILDQIARQVEDPGLKHSSPTHVGLELSIRHAAEFFGFYVCRFVLGDLNALMEKFVKRGTEWVLA
ncbi:hypothetical protein M409DRAFT_48728 [Zasmidium cellare ATCC 36951]|uniref:MIT domain-containing protein n=1 Tax=Zasmidium cellare ATCC 36951 TaxID=1080233 RepID=A0A6A6D840_ZASCE|nr:uncharacterized protein M409DRAFT_48728 [Zasmidium cellare ATCC 36951]KAF2173806.1 hypothetical protein M409DRAFT_48728 [Zasmidium cellare ATCC 36951]